jgi:hypothetical protein
MKIVVLIGVCLLLASCKQSPQKARDDEHKAPDQFAVFDETNHLQPLFDRAIFDTLHGFDFGWAILKPINIASSRDDDKELSKRFSPGQKALYFIWYLDEQVTNGGFVQFYLNGYREYILPIENGLQLIGDTAMLSLVKKADEEYVINQNEIDSYKLKNSWQPLYDKPFHFSEFDSIYYATNKRMMAYLEQYARKYPSAFVKFK